MIPLSTLEINTTATVSAIDPEDQGMLNKLFAMGIVPGVSLRLEQRFPSYIVQVGRTRASFDSKTAEKIYLRLN
jgi:ferrous iron transport protein A